MLDCLCILGCVFFNLLDMYPEMYCILHVNAGNTFAGSNNFFFFVHVVFVALSVAAAALQGRRRLEDVPEWPRAGLTAGREVIQSRDELVALVADVGGTLPKWQRLSRKLLVTFNFSFISIQDLEKGGECHFI